MIANRAFTIEVEDGEWVHLYLFEDGVQMCGSMYPVEEWDNAELRAQKDGLAWVAETAIFH